MDNKEQHVELDDCQGEYLYTNFEVITAEEKYSVKEMVSQRVVRHGRAKLEDISHP